MSRRTFQITPELMLRAYRAGLFPMAETRQGDRLYWLDPELRGVLPLDRFHLPRRLMRTVLAGPFEVASDRDFSGVIAGCAARRRGATTPGSTRKSSACSPNCTGSATRIPSSAGWTAGWWAASTAWRWAARSSARACSAASATPRKWRWCIWWRGCGWAASGCWIPSSSPRISPSSVPWRSGATAIEALLAAAVDLPARWLADPDPALLEAEFLAIAGRQQPQRPV